MTQPESLKIDDTKYIREDLCQTEQSGDLVLYLVTNTNRGVYMGWGPKVPDGDYSQLRATGTFTNVRHVYRYPKPEETGGTYSLATVGPAAGAKIGPPVIEQNIGDIANIVLCTQAAALALEAGKWGN